MYPLIYIKMEAKQGETKTRLVRWHKTMTLAFITSITEKVPLGPRKQEFQWKSVGDSGRASNEIWRVRSAHVDKTPKPRDWPETSQTIPIPAYLPRPDDDKAEWEKKGLAKQTYPGIRRTERTERLISSPALTVAGKGRAQVLKGECKSRDGRRSRSTF